MAHAIGHSTQSKTTPNPEMPEGLPTYDDLETARWEALVRLAHAVVSGATYPDPCVNTAECFADWLDILEADYVKAYQARAAAM